MATLTYMEIERKYLVVSGAYKKEAEAISHIVQGFLNTDPMRTVRIRIQNEKAYLTIKGISNEAGTIREEWELEIDRDMALQMLDICEESLIEKNRYHVRVGDQVYEVDEFLGDNAGLVIAEIELNSEDEKFSQPGWLGDEVTGDVRYYNSQLSKNPFMRW